MQIAYRTAEYVAVLAASEESVRIVREPPADLAERNGGALCGRLTCRRVGQQRSSPVIAVTAARALLSSYIWRRTAESTRHPANHGRRSLRRYTRQPPTIRKSCTPRQNRAQCAHVRRRGDALRLPGVRPAPLRQHRHRVPLGTPAAVCCAVRSWCLERRSSRHGARHRPVTTPTAPGKLAAALALTATTAGGRVARQFLPAARQTLARETVQVTPRHGIDYARFGREFPWRFRLSAR